MLFIYGMATIGRSVHLIFFDNLWMFGSRYIRKGEFERLLIMPINPLFQLICERVQLQGFGTTLMGAIATYQSYHLLGLHWNIFHLLLFVFICICIGLLYAAIQLGPPSPYETRYCILRRTTSNENLISSTAPNTAYSALTILTPCFWQMARLYDRGWFQVSVWEVILSV